MVKAIFGSILTTICLFVLINLNLFADVPDPVKGTCQSCVPPTKGVFSFGYDDKGNEITIFTPTEKGGSGPVINKGWGTFATGNGEDDEGEWIPDFPTFDDFILSLQIGEGSVGVLVEEEDVEVQIIDIYEFRTIISVFVTAGDYHWIVMPEPIRPRPYGLIATKNGQIVKTAIFYFN